MKVQAEMIVNVPVANVWTSYGSPREIDEDALSLPMKLESWLTKMSFEQRLELCNANLLQSQALYGQKVLVINENEDWAEVCIPEQQSNKDGRGYPGWIPKKHLASLAENFEQHTGHAAIRKKKAWLLDEKNRQPLLQLSYGTALPAAEVQNDYVKVRTPDGYGFFRREDVDIIEDFKSEKGSGQDIVDSGKQFLGLPYLWGGMSSFGFDCSGFSYTMCKMNGYLIPRDAGEQAQKGKKVELDHIQPGDLLFFAYNEGQGDLHHVGIYYGDGKLLHSPKTGKDIEIISIAGTFYEKELCTASRYWQETRA
ncbi:NlpC/P60 family protein [Bacillus sp. OV322]|nr:C40 family peptidase [Bacillus sp. OV322]SFC00474.1 NlpC/P60 family protein [Bacillus sp. OV322]